MRSLGHELRIDDEIRFGPLWNDPKGQLLEKWHLVRMAAQVTYPPTPRPPARRTPIAHDYSFIMSVNANVLGGPLSPRAPLPRQTKARVSIISPLKLPHPGTIRGR